MPTIVHKTHAQLQMSRDFVHLNNVHEDNFECDPVEERQDTCTSHLVSTFFLFSIFHSSFIFVNVLFIRSLSHLLSLCIASFLILSMYCLSPDVFLLFFFSFVLVLCYYCCVVMLFNFHRDYIYLFVIRIVLLLLIVRLYSREMWRTRISLLWSLDPFGTV